MAMVSQLLPKTCALSSSTSHNFITCLNTTGSSHRQELRDSGMYDLAPIVSEPETKNPAHAALRIYGADPPTAYLSLAPPLFKGHAPPSSMDPTNILCHRLQNTS